LAAEGGEEPLQDEEAAGGWVLLKCWRDEEVWVFDPVARKSKP